MNKFPMLKFSIVVLLLASLKNAIGQYVHLDPNLLTDKVEELVENSLKATDIQKHFDTFSYVEEALGEKQLNQIAQSIGNKFLDLVKVVRNLQKAVGTTYHSFSKSEPSSCCQITNLTYSQYHYTKVNQAEVCHYIPESIPSSRYVLPVEILKEAFLRNSKLYPLTRWQYFSTEDFIQYLYPAQNMSCGKDIRGPIRPWFFQAYFPFRSEVIIVIDQSTSTIKGFDGGNLPFQEVIAKAVEYTISPMDSYDKFAVIDFLDDAEVLHGDGPGKNCFSDSLAQATPRNKRKIRDVLKITQTNGRRNFLKALKKAFQLFRKPDQSYSGEDLRRVILFISSGDPEEPKENILQTLQNETERLNNSVVLFAYGIGDENFKVLEEMTKFSRNSTQKGRYFSVHDSETLLYELPFYYRHLFEPSSLEPSWTTPYLDDLGLGQVISVTLAVIINGTRIGAVSSDVTLDDIIIEAKYFKPNEFSYAFVTDGQGSIVYHPFYPSAIITETVYVEATSVEQDVEFLSIFESMKRGESGNKTYVATKYLRLEGDETTAVKKMKMLTQYIWKKIPNSNFSICFALSSNASSVELINDASIPFGSFLHDRLDLVPPKSPCVHGLATRPLSSKDQSSVSLTARTYSNPADYLFHSFTTEDILGIGKYIEGRGPNNFNITNAAKQDVIITYKAEELWLKEDEYTELRKYIGNRWIGTKNGVLRTYPATSLPKLFDVVLRPWYIAAEAHPDEYVITLPYDVAGSFGRDRFISLCRAITQRNWDDSNEPHKVVAVTAMGIFVNYFERIVRDIYSDWIDSDEYKFYLIDSAAYVILAKEYSTNKTTLHITEMEPEVSSALFLHGFLQRVNCSQLDVGQLRRQYLIKFSSSQGFFPGFIKGEGSSCYGFYLYEVPRTNTYIIVRTTTNVACRFVYLGNADICECPKGTSKMCKTMWKSRNNCECPCNDINPYYNPCRNVYEVQNGRFDNPPCGPKIAYSDYTDAVGVYYVTGLPICYELLLSPETDSLYVLPISLSAILILIIGTCGILQWKSKSLLAKSKVGHCDLQARELEIDLSSDDLDVESLEFYWLQASDKMENIS